MRILAADATSEMQHTTGPLQRGLLVDFHGTRASFFVRQSKVLWIGLFAYGAHILEEFEPNWRDWVLSVRGLNAD
jgi:hypothetical protein